MSVYNIPIHKFYLHGKKFNVAKEVLTWTVQHVATLRPAAPSNWRRTGRSRPRAAPSGPLPIYNIGR